MMSAVHESTDNKALSRLIIKRFRFWGIRALNWSHMPETVLHPDDHIETSKCAPWIDLGKINIVIGPNGGGKTTVLDLIRALGQPEIWPSLPRENQTGRMFSGFEFEGDDYAFRAEFRPSASQRDDAMFHERLLCIYPNTRDEDTTSIKCSLPISKERASAFAIENKKSLEWVSTIKESLKKSKVPVVSYCPPTSSNPESGINNIRDLLNEFRHFFSGISDIQIHNEIQENSSSSFESFRNNNSENRIGVVLKDDRVQSSIVELEYLSLGWRQFVYIMSFLRNAPEQSVVVLDEPDRVLHPRLQRILLQEIEKTADKRGQQVIIASHSPSLINPALINPLGGIVLRASGGRCTTLTDRRDVLDDLGVKSADLAQANGVIWVEGPTDRIYINHWLHLYAKSINKIPWVEGNDYQIAFYGGVLIKYISLLGAEDCRLEQLSIRSINRNCYVVIDKDLDNFDGIPVESRTEKHRILEEANVINQGVWVTQYYTIENYLPNKYNNYVVQNGSRTKIIGRKIDLADLFRTQSNEFKDSFCPESDLGAKIAELFIRISQWQASDVVIDSQLEMDTS